MEIRSGKGDKGITDLSFHKRVSKSSSDICAIGDLDELNCYLGLIKLKVKSRKDKDVFEKIQHGVSAIASEIVVGSEKKKKLGPILKKDDTDWIKRTVYRLEQDAGIERCFYLPGDGEISVFLDITRAVARRAERSVVKLLRKDKSKNDSILSYLNCISDVLFIAARKAAKKRKRR